MTTRRVVLLRHGRTASNATATWQGQTDIPLDEVGLAEAADAARVLTTLPAPQRLVSSDLSRARQTAEPLAAAWGMRLEFDQRLREVDAGAWEGLDRSRIGELWPDDLKRWMGGEDLQIGGGERISEAGTRFRECVQEIVDEAETSVVVGHGGVIRACVQQLVGLGQLRVLSTLRNAHWASLVRHPDGTWSIDAWNLGATLPSIPRPTVM